MESLRFTLNQMPDEFTSNQFSERAKANGVTQREVNNGILSAFLHTFAVQGNTRRTWRKTLNKTIFTKAISSQQQHLCDNKAERIKEAILLLKEEGYKVMRQEWREF